jgi:hypothetical protein
MDRLLITSGDALHRHLLSSLFFAVRRCLIAEDILRLFVQAFRVSIDGLEITECGVVFWSVPLFQDVVQSRVKSPIERFQSTKHYHPVRQLVGDEISWT